MEAKRNGFAVLGWLAWKLPAIIGLPYAKNKVRGGHDDPRLRWHGDAPGIPATT